MSSVGTKTKAIRRASALAVEEPVEIYALHYINSQLYRPDSWDNTWKMANLMDREANQTQAFFHVILRVTTKNRMGIPGNKLISIVSMANKKGLFTIME